MKFLTAAFYKFVELSDVDELKASLTQVCAEHEVKGLILLAQEGINSTIAGPEQGVQAVLAHLRRDPRLMDLVHKEAWSDRHPFYRMKVRIKKEIVTLGVADLSPARQAGIYVSPKNWNALISDSEVVVIDTRNDYEVEIGSFARAINPEIKRFADLPDWMEQSEELQSINGQRPRVAMFCTGGIRCEKSTALLRARGFDEVYHLEGGILKYLETIAPEESLWKGQCFVFDERVSVGHGLEVGPLGLCRACRQPLLQAHMTSTQYVPGVSCPRCTNNTSPAQKNGAMERQRQWELAKKRQKAHIGAHLPRPVDSQA